MRWALTGRSMRRRPSRFTRRSSTCIVRRHGWTMMGWRIRCWMGRRCIDFLRTARGRLWRRRIEGGECASSQVSEAAGRGTGTDVDRAGAEFHRISGDGIQGEIAMPEAVIVAAVRTPVGRAPKGALSTTRPDDLAAVALSGALERVPALEKTAIDDVILGCAQPEGEQGWNIARMAALRAGLPVEIPGATVNRLCASGLEAIAIADERIRAGAARAIVAGGAESMSLIPMGGSKPSPNPWLAGNYTLAP